MKSYRKGQTRVSLPSNDQEVTTHRESEERQEKKMRTRFLVIGKNLSDFFFVAFFVSRSKIIAVLYIFSTKISMFLSIVYLLKKNALLRVYITRVGGNYSLEM